MTNDRVGKILKDLRKQKGIALKQLSKTLGVDRAHLSRIETGKVMPSDTLLRRMSRRLGGDIEMLAIMSGRLPKDIQALFVERPKEVVSFLRRAGGFNGGHSMVREGEDAQFAGIQRKYRVADLFCGAGGFTAGLIRTGRFEPVFANDFNRWAVDTYNYNFGEHCVGGDINALLERKDHELPAADLVIGGPPCQGFSLLNKKLSGKNTS